MLVNEEHEGSKRLIVLSLHKRAIQELQLWGCRVKTLQRQRDAPVFQGVINGMLAGHFCNFMTPMLTFSVSIRPTSGSVVLSSSLKSM
jgi:hypothetical protein